MATPDLHDPNHPLHRFPRLNSGNYEKTSQRSRYYNCVAWAAGIDNKQIWPGGGEGYEEEPAICWPEGIPNEERVESFVAYFSGLDYAECNGPELEPGFLKIAIFVNHLGTPTHVCRQLPSGRWTSKLGWDGVDIEHDGLECISGGLYGRATVFMRKPL